MIHLAKYLFLFICVMLITSGCASGLKAKTHAGKDLEARFNKLERAVAEELVRLENQINAQEKELERLKSGGKPLPKAPKNRLIIPPEEKIITKMPSAQTQKDIEELYPEGRARFLKGDYNGAIEVFQVLASKYPKHSLTANAFFWIGEAYYKMQQYNKAVTEYKKVPILFPKSAKAPEALLKIANAYSRLRMGNEAMTYLRILLKKYPQSSSSAMVRQGTTIFR